MPLIKNNRKISIAILAVIALAVLSVLIIKIKIDRITAFEECDKAGRLIWSRKIPSLVPGSSSYEECTLLGGKTFKKAIPELKAADIKTFEQCNSAGFPIIRHYPDQCQTPDGRIFVNENPPSESELVKAEDSIRTFMGESSLGLKYIRQSRHPSNFAVLSNVKQNEGGLTADNPEEWDRPIYVLQQTNYINDRCEVYEYEVSIKTSQVIEVHVRYPAGTDPMTTDSARLQCKQYGSWEVPLKTRTEIEQAAFAYLARDPEHTKITLRSDIQPEYIPSKQGVANPAHNIWQWEDKSFKLPEGLMGDPSPYPTLRIVMSSSGKLVNYLNTTDLFNPNYLQN